MRRLSHGRVSIGKSRADNDLLADLRAFAIALPIEIDYRA
jgi:hypothetical protein